MLGLPDDFDITTLKVGSTYTIAKDKDRIFPLHLAILIVKRPEWTFFGYGVTHSSTIKDGKTTLTFEVLSLFSPEEQKLYQAKYIEAAKKSGELN